MASKAWFALLCVVAALWAAPSAHAQEGAWLRAESENFIVYSRGRERPLREAVQRLEHFNDLLHEITGAARPETPVKLTIHLLRNHYDLLTVWPTAGQSILGFYTYQPESVSAFAIYNDSGWEGVAQQTLFHEYTHHFMMQYFRTAYPSWYVEGFAEYLSTVEFTRGRTMVGKPSFMREASLVGLARMPLLPMQTMLGAMPEGQEERAQFYAQSWLMTHYMFSTPERQRAFNAYMRAIGSGGESVQSFETAFGVSLDEFRRQLGQYMRGTIQYTVYPNRELAEDTITVTRMPRSADDLLLLNARMLRWRGENAELSSQIAEIAAQFPGDAFAARSAAYAELIRNPTRARELVSPLIEADPQDFEAQYLMGRSFFEEAESADGDRDAAMAQARRHFVRAFRANPNHVPTLYYYVRSQSTYPMPDEVLDVLIQAHLLAPQVDEIRFNLAIQLLNSRRFPEAATLLRPIAYNPHGGETAARARRYLEAAQRDEMPDW